MLLGMPLDAYLTKTIIYCIFGLTLYIGIIVDSDWFSPYTLFASFYACLLIYSSEISNYFLPPISDRSMVLILLGSISFMGGMGAYSKFKISKRLRIPTYSESNACDSLHTYSHWYLLLIGLLPTIFSIATKGLPVLALGSLSQIEIQELRSTYYAPIITTLTCLVNAAILVAMRSRNKVDIFIVTLIAIGASTIIFAKSSLVITLFFITYGLYHYKLTLKTRYKLVFVVLSITCFFLLAQSYWYARGSVAGDLFSFETEYISQNRSTYFEEKRGIYTTYMYLTTPLSNLDYLMENFDHQTNGKMTLWSIISLTQIKRVFDIKQEFKPIRAHPFNTHSFLADFYMDFGIVGCIIMPFILGIFVYFFYIRALKSQDPIIISIYLYWGYATFMMFFSNHFTSVGYPLTYLIVLEGYRFISKSFKSKINISKFSNRI